MRTLPSRVKWPAARARSEIRRAACAFAKDAQLASDANKILGDLKKEGFIANLHQKWFGAKAEDTTSTVQERDMPKAQ